MGDKAVKKYHPDQEDQYDAGFGKTYNPEPAPTEGNPCKGCAFHNSGGCLSAPACSEESRLDGRDIIWVAA